MQKIISGAICERKKKKKEYFLFGSLRYETVVIVVLNSVGIRAERNLD